VRLRRAQGELGAHASGAHKGSWKRIPPARTRGTGSARLWRAQGELEARASGAHKGSWKRAPPARTRGTGSAHLRHAYYLAQHALLTHPEQFTLAFSKLGYCKTFSRPQRGRVRIEECRRRWEQRTHNTLAIGHPDAEPERECIEPISMPTQTCNPAISSTNC
jgi:hypothetical protein